ncbi:MAG: MSCRAMM family adhesin SdrC, partial [Anaerolineae bacterium]|nr:MSCRAMM family adhesin SdrC [Anaerolineae bacterium]
VEAESEVSSGVFQLGAGASMTIQAGYGEPALTAGELSAQMSPVCEPPAHVQGRIWQDLNGDSLPGDDEAGIAGVIVSLTNDDGSVVQTVTIEDGHYDFFPVGEGHYVVQVQADSLPPDVLNSADPDGENDSTAGVDVAAGDVVILNFGYEPTGTASISGVIWLETANFSTRDSGEKGLDGVRVELLDTNGSVLAETGIDVDGRYRFDELGAGNYTVRLASATLPQPYGITFNPDSEFNLETFVSLSSGQSVENIDFGVVGTF